MSVVQTLIGNIKGVKGDTGAQGQQGIQGDAATIAVGTVTTVPYGQTADITNSGTNQAAVFDFKIPQGKPGEQVTDLQNLTLGAITTSSADFPIPAVNDTGKVLWGKVVKWFSDMSALVATKLNVANVVNNLTTEDSGYALDARQGKALKGTLDSYAWRNQLRFKNLGTSFTAEQQAALAAGDFTDLWNGDYWVINNVTWRIVDNSGWGRRYGDVAFDSPSIVVMPDQCLVSAAAYMIDSGSSTGNGYANCGYRTTYRTTCKTAFQNAFGASHIAARREMMSTSRAASGAAGWGWQDADVELPAEENLRGFSAFGGSSDCGGSGYNSGMNGQFKLYQLAPYMLIDGVSVENYWTRTIANISAFSCVLSWGLVSLADPNVDYIGLRPYAIIV